jgi:hypothetical protein
MDIDKEIAEKVMGIKALLDTDNKCRKVELLEDGREALIYHPESLFNPSTNISDAWLVVEKMQQERNLCIELAHYSGIGYRCGFWGGESTKTIEEKSAPLAICKAALAAIDTNH